MKIKIYLTNFVSLKESVPSKRKEHQVDFKTRNFFGNEEPPKTNFFLKEINDVI